MQTATGLSPGPKRVGWIKSLRAVVRQAMTRAAERSTLGAALVLHLVGCAAPAGTQAVNPVCLFRCHVDVTDIHGLPALTTLTTTDGAATAGDASRAITTTTAIGP